MGIKITGIKKIRRAINKYPTRFKKEIGSVVTNYGARMQGFARRNHDYISRSGNLDRAITFKRLDRSKLIWAFFIDYTITAVSWKGKKVSYGIFQHEGTGRNYSYSGLTEKRYSGNSKHKGIKHDHFILRAWNKYSKNMVNKIRKVIVDVTKKTMEGR